MLFCTLVLVFFFKQKTAYELRISDWSSDVCSSDLLLGKHLADSYPIPVLVFFRSFFALLACLVVMAATGGRAHFGTRRPVALVLRALVWLAIDRKSHV